MSEHEAAVEAAQAAYFAAIGAGADADERRPFYARFTAALAAKVAAEREPDPRDAEIARLRAENKRLRVALVQIGQTADASVNAVMESEHG